MTVAETEILVLGVGNSLMGDERASVRAAHLLRRRLPPSIRVLALAGVGPAVMADLDGASHILVLDCIDVGRAPGSIVVFEADDLSPCAARSVFRFGVADLLAAVGQTAEAPERAVVLGLQPASTEPGTTLSPEVESAVPLLVDRAVHLLATWLDGGSSLGGGPTPSPCAQAARSLLG
jgi:hydrogenase maturation protease